MQTVLSVDFTSGKCTRWGVAIVQIEGARSYGEGGVVGDQPSLIEGVAFPDGSSDPQAQVAGEEGQWEGVLWVSTWAGPEQQRRWSEGAVGGQHRSWQFCTWAYDF